MSAKTSKAQSRRLTEFMCFSIYSANLAFGRAYKPIMDKLGLASYTQYIAIVALWEEDGQTVSGLGDKLFLESNTLTPMLKKLEEMGYVKRQRDPEDERQVRVYLTPQGRRLREKGLTMNLVKETGLPPEEFARVQQAVSRIRDNLLNATQPQD